MRNSELWAVEDARPYNQTLRMAMIVGDGVPDVPKMQIAHEEERGVVT